MTGPRISHVMIDAIDPEVVAGFWAALLRTEVESTFDEGRFTFLSAGEHGPSVGIQRVPEAKVVKNRVHLDLEVDDLERATMRVHELGGSSVADQETAGVRWRIVADPEGNEFCLVPRRAA
ncbi:MAG TPA: VOC family protein [Actinomycetota bacterium]